MIHCRHHQSLSHGSRTLHCLLLCLAVLGTAPALAQAADEVWTVRLPAPALTGPGLWERNGTVLAGAFRHQDEAAALAASFAGAVVERASPPQPHQWRPWRQRLTLADMGWTTPQVVQGTEPFLTLRLPWLEGAMAQGSRITVQVLVPPGLHPNSRLSLWAAGIPLVAAPVRGEAVTLDAPLDALAGLSLEDVLTVEVRGELSWSGDRCVDARSPALWLRVEPSSALELVRQGPARTVRGALQEAGVLGARLVQRSDGRPGLEAACRLAAALGQLAWRDDALTLAASPGLGPSLVVDEHVEDILWTGTTLYLSPRGAELVASRWMPALLAAGARVAQTGQEAVQTSAISLAALGIPGATVRGQGDLVVPLRLRLAQLGGWPRTLVLGLSTAHSAIPEGDHAMLLVRLGGRVLESQELRGAGARRLTRVEVPGHLLQADTTLEVVFRYTPRHQGNCGGPSAPSLEASLLEDSFLELQGNLGSPPLTLASFPALALGHGVVVSSASHARQTPNLLALCQALGRLRPAPAMALRLAAPGETTTAGFVITDDLSLPGLTPLALPLAATEIRNPLTGAVLLRFTPDAPLTLVQTFRDPQGRPVLAVSGPPALPPRLPGLLAAAGGANLMVAREGAWQFFEIGDKFRVVQPAAKDLIWYLQQYRLALFLVLAALLLAGLVALYLRAGRRTP